MHAHAATEKSRLADAGPARVARSLLGDVRRAAADRVETGDRLALRVEDLAVDRDVEPAEREAHVGRRADRGVERRVGRMGQRLEPLLALVEIGILAL